MRREIILNKNEHISFPVQWLEGKEKTVVFKKYVPVEWPCDGTNYFKMSFEETFFECIKWSKEKEVQYFNTFDGRYEIEHNVILMKIERYDRKNEEAWNRTANCQIIVKSIKPTKSIIWI